MGHQFREVRPNTQPGLPVSRNALQHATVHSGSQWHPCWKCISRSSQFNSTGWPTLSSQHAISTGCWAWWCLWQRWYVVEDYISDQSIGGQPQHGARAPEIGPTRSQFLSGNTILHSHAAEVVRSQGDQAGASPSARSSQRPGGCTVQNRPESQHQVDVGHGTSTTSVYQVGRTADRHVCYIRQQMTDQVCIAISGPQGRVDGCDVHYLGQREGPPVYVPAIQVGPSGSAEDLPVSRGANDSVSSQARNIFLVSGASGTVARRFDPAVCRRSAPAHPTLLEAQTIKTPWKSH